MLDDTSVSEPFLTGLRLLSSVVKSLCTTIPLKPRLSISVASVVSADACVDMAGLLSLMMPLLLRRCQSLKTPSLLYMMDCDCALECESLV